MNFAQSPQTVARQLIGWTLLVDGIGGVIVETEAYDMDDEASHSFKGPTLRNAPMFGPPGRAYVYLSYGLHWCLNVVCQEAGHGAAVLIRALEPTHGLEAMRARRGCHRAELLASGPGRVGQALAIDRSFNGLAFDEPPFELLAPRDEIELVVGVRIGITKAGHLPWRFGIANSPFLSKRFSEAAHGAARDLV
ncbi:DNA-3-methyladenine glycosylase [Pelomonas saccharophila]|uniref:Putative 3-methyladenine DNA glycosylase n=1 Tax=Roseateles saccharophilus TaxID=304 RepID=A0ABU1YNQ1_ROSSA|nr:DNA-3-methyladenine glycosylase [Roseateles saccharophilus]